jgi:hypothetical protein
MLKPRSIKVLESLALFKYLSVNQLIRLRVSMYPQSFTKVFKELILHNMVWVIRFGVDPKRWKIPNVYYLKEKWVQFLIQEFNLKKERIKYPIGTSSMFFKDYYHRVSCIDFQIEMVLYLISIWWEMIQYSSYFDKIGCNIWSQREHKKNSKNRNRNSKLNSIWKLNTSSGSSKKYEELYDGSLTSKCKLYFRDWNYFIPDGLMKYKIDWKVKIATLEMYNGNDTKRVVRQLLQHIESLKQWLPSLEFDVKIWSRVFVLFETKSAMVSLIELINRWEWVIKEFRYFREHFLFNHLDAMKEEFDSWIYFDGEFALL